MRHVVISGIRPSFPGLSRSRGQVTHVLLTRSPLTTHPKADGPFDLHVLSTPPAFVLSQDQTLQQNQTENTTPKGSRPQQKPTHPTHRQAQQTPTNKQTHC